MKEVFVFVIYFHPALSIKSFSFPQMIFFIISLNEFARLPLKFLLKHLIAVFLEFLRAETIEFQIWQNLSRILSLETVSIPKLNWIWVDFLRVETIEFQIRQNLSRFFVAKSGNQRGNTANHPFNRETGDCESESGLCNPPSDNFDRQRPAISDQSHPSSARD